MKRIFYGFLAGVLAGVACSWYWAGHHDQIFSGSTGQKMMRGAENVKNSIEQRVGEIKTEDIKEELARTGTVIREKALQVGAAISDATADTRITASVKAGLLKEPGLSSLQIHVNTSDGLVTLSGTIGSYDDVGKAVRVALETDGVHKVISTLQVKAGG